MNSKLTSFVAAACLLAFPLTSIADSIIVPNPIGSYGRQATLSSAEEGAFGLGNPQDSDINGDFGGSWTKVGDVNNGNGLSNGYLTITMTGDWDDQPAISGTWSISPLFWTIYGSAVISMHVGNGRPGDLNDPDYFAWLITPNQLQGTWSYDFNLGNGGGLSNLGLWGSGKPTQVPDGGATAMLVGATLLTLAGAARRRSAR